MSDYVTKQDLTDALAPIKQDIHCISQRLFHDNGSPSWQTRIDRNTRVVNALLWMVGALLVSIVGAVVTKVI